MKSSAAWIVWELCGYELVVAAVPSVEKRLALDALGDAVGPGGVPEIVVCASVDGILAVAGDDGLLVVVRDLVAFLGGQERGADPGAVRAGGEDGCEGGRW